MLCISDEQVSYLNGCAKRDFAERLTEFARKKHCDDCRGLTDSDLLALARHAVEASEALGLRQQNNFAKVFLLSVRYRSMILDEPEFRGYLAEVSHPDRYFPFLEDAEFEPVWDRLEAQR